MKDLNLAELHKPFAKYSIGSWQLVTFVKSHFVKNANDFHIVTELTVHCTQPTWFVLVVIAMAMAIV